MRIERLTERSLARPVEHRGQEAHGVFNEPDIEPGIESGMEQARAPWLVRLVRPRTTGGRQRRLGSGTFSLASGRGHGVVPGGERGFRADTLAIALRAAALPSSGSQRRTERGE
jgi:hypothetical protein